MRRGLAALAVLALAVGLTACGAEVSDHSDDSSYSPGTGIGMTYNGKLGIDMGGGFVQPFTGGGPSLGYGM